MQVSDVYQPQLVTCQADDRLTDAARLMADEVVGALLVVEDRRVLGILSERDVTRAVATETDLATVTARQYASTGLKVATLDDDTERIAERMIEAGIRHLPVVEDHELVGMVSMRDLLAVETWG